MASTWRRPGLTAIEVLWRWSVGLPLLWLAIRAVAGILRGHPVDTGALEAMTVFQPTAALDTLGRQALPLLPPLYRVTRWLLPAGVAAWVAASTAGRLQIWRRLDRSLPTRAADVGRVAVLGFLRVLLLLGTLLAWLWGIGAAGRYSLSSATDAGAEPNLVTFSAMLVVLTLLLFLLWSLAVWAFDAAPLFVLVEGQGLGESIRSAWRAHALRSKLIEINLVMGIVKVGLTVLAMVFSATPLPFAAEETQGFLIGWWSFVGVLFLLALDFFHVVRRAANLSFFWTLVRPKDDTDRAPERPFAP